MQNLYKRLYEIGIIPVIKIDDAAKAVPLAHALSEGGLPAAEITFRTSAAAEAIRAIADACPDMVLGAGTVLTVEQADEAKRAGAHFIVSPGLNPRVVKHCGEIGMPILPGCSNPSDIEAALEFGLDTVKFFPAEAAGGLPMLKAMAAPYGNVRFMPTGGLNENNILSYLSFDKIIACGGSFMVKDEYIRAGEFDKIRALTESAVKKMLGFQIKHVGINSENAAEAAALVKSFAPFGPEAHENDGGYFLGSDIEILKQKGYGKYGHIAIGTNFIKRAEAYLTAKGVRFLEESKKPDANGNYPAVYVDGDFGGFAVHLLQNK